MAIKIVTAQAPMEGYDIGQIPIDLSRKTGVLMRQSRKGSDKDHYESRLRQESLVPVAMALRGDADDTNILVYDEGAGVSGTKGYDQRPKLSRLYIDIANGVIGSIVVARADRLFRDKHFRNVSMFTEIAEEKKIILVVPGRTSYDFTKTKDLQAFQKEMQDAYNFITTQVAYMIENRAQKVRRGLYGGGRLPAPYVIDRQAWKEEQKHIIYQPWLEPAITLFKRFHEYDFSLARIAAYIDGLPYLFPQPSLEDTRKYLFSTIMGVVPGGYTISSPDSLKHYLSNLTLGGFAKIGRDEDGNELLLPNAFEAAVPMELLEPAYASITGYYLDGTPFEKSRSSTRQTRRTYTLQVHAVLHGFLTSSDGAVSLYSNNEDQNPHYTCHQGSNGNGWELKNRIGILKQKKLWSLSCRELDRIILERLFNLVEHDSDMVERIKAFWESRKTEEVDEGYVLKQQIKKAQDQIAHLDKLLTNPARPLSKTTEARYLSMLDDAEADLARLQRKQAERQELEEPESIIPNFYYVLAHLPAEYKKLSIEGQKKMMRIVAKEVRLGMLSPHLFRLYIEWENGIAVRPDVVLVWRGITPNICEEWSEEEDTMMRRFYPEKPQVELMKAFPHRSWYRICDRAQVLHLRRSLPHQGRARVNGYHRTMRYDDLEAVAHLGESREEKERLCQIANELAQRTMRGGLSAHWWLPLEGISYAGICIDEASEGNDVDLFNLSAFPCGVPHPT
jgi:DNA invertase Pin-like site-specific DNA recombinase